MSIYSPKATSDLPNPPQDDDARFADLFCTQIHSIVSQLHQHGKLGPERISNQLFSLAAAVKQLADQYAIDHLSHFPSVAGHTDHNEFFTRFPVSSNSASSVHQEELELRTPLSDLFAKFSPACTADDNHRWLSERPFGNFSLSNIPSAATDPSAAPSLDGTCKPSDLVPPPDVQDFRSSTLVYQTGNGLLAISRLQEGPGEGECEINNTKIQLILIIAMQKRGRKKKKKKKKGLRKE